MEDLMYTSSLLLPMSCMKRRSKLVSIRPTPGCCSVVVVTTRTHVLESTLSYLRTNVYVNSKACTLVVRSLSSCA
jgi:hypothetical protein